jgi:hypothetical protein
MLFSPYLYFIPLIIVSIPQNYEQFYTNIQAKDSSPEAEVYSRRGAFYIDKPK